MKLSLAAFTLPLLMACGTRPSAFPPPVPAPTEVAEPEPQPIQVNETKWSITLPANWIIRTSSPKPESQITQELVARSPKTMGTVPSLVSVNTVTLNLDDPADEDFGGAIAVAMIKSGMTVLIAQPTKVSGLKGSFVMIVLPNSGVVVLQKAVGHKRTGFVVRCGGATQQGDEIIELCRPILESFHIEP